MKKLLASAAVVALATAALSGCAGAADAAGCQNTILQPDAKQVTLWSWYPNFGDVVDLYNKAHKDVQICWTNAGAGTGEYTKFTTAIQAGSGAPDVVMLETQVIPSYIADGSIVNLSELGADAVKQNYSAGAWADESKDGSVYAIPVDGGPVGLMYRKDLFDKYRIPVPTTWAEYATAAEAIKTASGGKTLIGDFPGNGGAFQTALFAQAGSKPFTVSGSEKIGIRLDDPASRRVLGYWGDLVDKKLVGTENTFTTDYNTHLLDGSYATAVAAAWLPGYLEGFTGADKTAKWAVAPVPQWDPAAPVQINQGGSTFAVSKQAPDPKLAAKVAMEVFGTEEAWTIGIEKAALFPMWKPALESDSFAQKAYPFFGGQQINKDVFLAAATDYQGFQFSPFQNLVYDKQNDAMQAVIKGKSTPDEALASLQKSVVSYAEQQGYTVTK